MDKGLNRARKGEMGDNETEEADQAGGGGNESSAHPRFDPPSWSNPDFVCSNSTGSGPL